MKYTKVEILIYCIICGIVFGVILSVQDQMDAKDRGNYISVEPVKAEQLPAADPASYHPVLIPVVTPSPTPMSTPKPQKIKVIKKKLPCVDEHSVDLLARVMEAENGSNTDEALTLTGVVVLKRVKSKEFPNSIKGVLSDGGYSTWDDGKIQQTVPSDRCLEIAEELLTMDLEKEYPDNLIYQAMFSQGQDIYRIINGEYFCLE